VVLAKVVACRAGLENREQILMVRFRDLAYRGTPF
jgi:hypothetical protein